MRELALGSIMLAAIILVPVLVVCVECIAALLPRRQVRAVDASLTPRPSVIVLIPAHDEEPVLGRTLSDLKPMITGTDRLLVVADNCTDKTAEVARAFGAEVVERNDRSNVGKGYALDFAARHLAAGLAADAAAVVIIIDADCNVAPGTLTALADQVTATGCPAQAVYLMKSPPVASKPGDLVSTLAFLVRNQVRPRGLHRLGLPCSLTGSGMAFPWEVFSTAPLATACIVEDLQLGIQLLIDGRATRLCEDARITGTLPGDRGDAVAQRTRWEHGHLRLALTEVPRLIGSAFTTLRIAPLATALDIAVPPLSLLVMTLFIATCVAGIFAGVGGSRVPLAMLVSGNFALICCLLIAWAAFGREILPLSASIAVPRYVLSKVPLYVRFLTRRQTRWVRTPRDPIAPVIADPTSAAPVAPVASESEN